MPIIPVIRCSAIGRSIAFYTEVLDFQLVGVWPEMSDPAFSIVIREGAELHLSSHAGDGSYGQSVTVLVRDLDAVFARFVARGLDVSSRTDSPIHQEPTDQTWGTREFCADDPDGNTVCFTQRPAAWTLAFPIACPEVPVADLTAASAEYRDRLGFTIDWGDPDLGLGQVSRGSSRLFLATPRFRPAEPVRLWINLESRAEIDALYDEWTKAGVDTDGGPEATPWNLYEFTARDAFGNKLRVFYDSGWEGRA